MLLLPAWYLCCQVRLEPAETAAYLDVLDVFAAPYRSVDRLRFAVEQFARTERTMQVYAIPILVEALRTDAPGGTGADTAAVVAELLAEALATAAGRAMPSPLTELIAGLSSWSGDELLQRLAAVQGWGRAAVSAEPYLDLADHAVPVMMLAVLRSVAWRTPERAAHLCNSEQALGVVDQAREGRYGRLPLLLAIETLAAVGEPVTELAETLLGGEGVAGVTEPDVMAAYARIRFLPQPGTVEAEELVEAVEREAVTLWYFDRSTRGRREAAQPYRWLGATEKDPLLPRVLWQATLWALAVRAAPEPAARQLARWWGPPGQARADDRSRPVHLPTDARQADRMRGVLRGLLSRRMLLTGQEPPQAEVRQSHQGRNSPETAAMFWSPWLVRSDAQYLRGRKKDRYSPGGQGQAPTFPHVDDLISLIRLFAAVEVVTDLLAVTAAGQAPEFAVELMLHAGDVFHTARFRDPLANLRHGKPWQPSSTPMSPQVTALALHASEIVRSRVAAGSEPALPPSRFADYLTANVRFQPDRNGKPLPVRRTPQQRSWLLSAPAVLLATEWAYESYSGYVDQPDAEAHAAWFAGEPSAAFRVVELALTGTREYLVKNYGDGVAAAMLEIARSMERSEFADPDDPGSPAGTDHPLTGEPTRPSVRSVLLAPLLDVPGWARVGDLAHHGLRQASYLAALTVRLLALLAEKGEAGKRPEWVAEWLRAVNEINNSRDFPRDVRSEIIHLFDASAGDPASSRVIRDVLELAVDAIGEFSRNAPRYLELLAGRLQGNALGAGRSTTNALRRRFMRTLVARERDPDTSSGLLVSPWSRARAEMAARQRLGLLERFAYLTSPQVDLFPGADTPPEEARHQVLLRAPGPADGRIVVSTRREGAGLVHVAVRSTLSSPAMVDLFASEARTNDRLTPYENATRAFTAVVAGVSAPNANGKVRAALNWGAGRTVPADVPAGYQIGDLVSVRITVRRGRTEVGRTEPFHPLPVAGARRQFTVVLKGQQLKLGDDGDPKPFNPAADVLELWDPDVSRSYRTEQLRHPVTAVWDGDLGDWVPEQRDFAQLIAAEFADEQSRAEPRTMVVVAETEDGLLLSARPGYNYLLPDRVWEPDSADRLRRQLVRVGEGGRSTGLLLHVRLTERDRQPRLALAADPSGEALGRWPGLAATEFDDRNVRWARMFDDSESLIARRAGVRWRYQSTVTEITDSVQAVVTGPDSERTAGESLLLFTVDQRHWDARAQRSGQVTVTRTPIRSMRDHTTEDPDRFDFLDDLEPGTVLRLSSINTRRKPWGSSYTGWTPDNIEVAVAAETVSFAAGDPGTGNLTRNRLAVVTRIERRQAPKATTDAQPVPDAELVPDDEERKVRLTALKRVARARGFIVMAGPSSRDARAPAYGVWLDCDEDVVYCEVPGRAFTNLPRRIGERVTAERSAHGWTFTVDSRVIHTRALWRAVPDRETGKSPTALYLGTCRAGGYGYRKLLQRRDQPEILLRFLDGDNAHHLAESGRTDRSGLRPGTGVVDRIAEFRDRGVWRARVRLRTRDGDLYGDARGGAFPPAGGNWLHIQVSAEEYEDTADNTRWFDIHRDFQPAKVTAAATTADELQGNRERTFQDWLDEGTALAEGTVDVDKLRLFRLEVPVNDTDWTSTVALRDGNRPWVDGRNYDTRNARALLRRTTTGTWEASCRDVPALTVDEFAASLRLTARTAGERRIDNHIMYVAGGSEDACRFEWGHGRTVLVPLDRLEVGGRIGTDQPFFFGDRITAFSFGHAATPDGTTRLVLRIAPADVEAEIESQVWDDARKRIVQLLEIVIDTRRQSVSIDNVVVRNRRIGRSADRDRHGHQRRLRNAVIDSRDAARLYAAMTQKDQQTRRRTILARLTDDPVDGSDPKLVFRYLSPSVGEGDGVLHPNDRLFMLAGPIQPKSTRPGEVSNDYLVPFTLPGDLADPDGPTLRVEVRRREFSLRESTLRHLYRTDRERYEGRQMLVTLEGPLRGRGRGAWQGSLHTAPARPLHLLREHIRLATERVFATIGDRTGDHLRVEIVPGVLVLIPCRDETTGQLRPGTVVALAIDGDRITMDKAIAGDRTYLTGNRPAVLLPKDFLLGSRSNPGDDDRRALFTVAGLPGVQLATGARTARLMRHPHPKLATVGLRAGKPAVDPDTPVRAATITCDPTTHQPRLTAVPGSAGPAPDVGWPQLSFADRSSKDLARHSRTGCWYYHDIETGWWPPGESGVRRTPLPVPARPATEPVFFSEGWTLRHPENRLTAYGFPATMLVEQGVPADNAWYPVAATTPRGLWAEMAPGHIVEITGQLLAPPRHGRRHLGAFDWTEFGTGDEIRLRRPAGAGLLAALVLEDWRPGPRGVWAGTRVLLPVSGGRPGAITLGTGIWSLTYPLGPDDALPDGSVRWLEPGNTLREPGDPMPGDVILVTAAPDGTLRAVGCGERGIRLSSRSWTGTDWLKDALADPARSAATLDLFGGALPMVVDEIRDGHLAIRWQQPAAPARSIQRLGRILGTLSDGRAVIRTGRSLLALRLENLIPGLPAPESAVVAAALRDEPIWLNRTQQGWRTGLLDPATASPGTTRTGPDVTTGPGGTGTGGAGVDTTVTPVAGAGTGIVCRETATDALRWLPTRHAAWADGLDGTVLSRWLADGDLPAVVQTDGAVSFTRSAEAVQIWDRLRPGSRQRVVPAEQAGTLAGGRLLRYAARLYPGHGLVELLSEHELPPGEPIMAIVDERTESPHPAVRVVPFRTRRTRLDLSRELAHALAHRQVPTRFAAYLDAHVTGTAALPAGAPTGLPATSAEGSAGLPETPVAGVAGQPGVPADTGAALITLAAAPRTARTGVVLPEPLLAWLDTDGRTVAGLGDGPAVDLAPALAAVLLLHEIGPRDDALTRDANRLAVHLTRRLGLLAGRNLHLEPLLRHWLQAPAAAERGGQWLRLAALQLRGRRSVHPDTGEEPFDDEFDGLLRPDQAEELGDFCRGVLGRATANTENELVAVASALLAALGEPHDVTRLLRPAHATDGILWQLSALARALTPAGPDLTAQLYLDRDQLRHLTNLWRILLTGKLALSLLPSVEPVPDNEARTVRGLLNRLLSRRAGTS